MNPNTQAVEKIKSNIESIRGLIQPLSEFVLYVLGVTTEKLTEELKIKNSSANGFLMILQEIRRGKLFYFGPNVELIKPSLCKTLDSLSVLIEMSGRKNTNAIDPLRARLISDVPVIVRNISFRANELEELLEQAQWPDRDTKPTKKQLDQFYAHAYLSILKTARWVRIPKYAASHWCEIVRWYRDIDDNDVFWIEVKLPGGEVAPTVTEVCCVDMQFKD